MKPVDTFLRSVRDAFHPSDDAPAWLWIGMAFCLSVAITVTLIRRRRRRQTDERSFARFLAERNVSPRQAQLLGRLATAVPVSPQVAATHIDVFEHATAQELARHAPSPTNGDAGIFAEVGALRRALGFERISGHFTLLTTRELGAGQIVEVAGVEATVTEVNEACFAAAAPTSSSFPLGPTGSRIRVTLIHGQEARYETRCTLLARQLGESTQRLVFGHDEQPTRIQLRKSVRVTVRGPVRLNPLGGAPAAPPEGDLGPAEEGAPAILGNGSLRDISVGGAALDANIHVPVGSLVQLSFDMDGIPYRDLLAFVLECQPHPRDRHHMRLEFRNLPASDERQLAASVARYSAKPLAQQT